MHHECDEKKLIHFAFLSIHWPMQVDQTCGLRMEFQKDTVQRLSQGEDFFSLKLLRKANAAQLNVIIDSRWSDHFLLTQRSGRSPLRNAYQWIFSIVRSSHRFHCSRFVFLGLSASVYHPWSTYIYIRPKSALILTLYFVSNLLFPLDRSRDELISPICVMSVSITVCRPKWPIGVLR